jgi:3-methylcrotonyl-CoA carboxylase alpha subunit
MFSSVLIANRGEIACRIARTAQRLSLRTIAVYSDADANALHVRASDEAHYIGRSPARESYLDIHKLLAVATEAKAECIHPGYGFLSERAEFAEACAKAGIVFVGPPPQAMRTMGLKDRAKALMAKAGVPIVPGYHGELQDPRLLKRKAYEIGYPVLIKAVAGGGGKGMRRVDKHADFDHALEAAMREAASAFGDNRVLIEKYITSPRHIEIQVFADQHGNIIHLNERDCSLQRRHQKVIEEAPAPGMTPQLRERMGAAAIAAAIAVGYVGAGTVEFIADGSHRLNTDSFWFMEMNTRLQVEHPVTESVTGTDLVEWQFRVAAGEKLPLRQHEVKLAGHAMEARIYAEDPEHNFLPSTGKLVALQFPEGEGLRVDSGVEAGGQVTPYYDPMIAKLIAHGASREAALDKLGNALTDTVIAGPRTNLSFLVALCRAADFAAGDFDTGFIDRNLEKLGALPQDIDRAAAALGAARLIAREQARISARRDPSEVPSPWDSGDAFQLSGERAGAIPISIDGKSAQAIITYGAANMSVTIDGVAPDPSATAIESPDAVYVLRGGRQTIVRLTNFETMDVGQLESDGVIKAPMHGKVLALLVEVGENVAKGHRVAIIEAMKMEHALSAPLDGMVSEIAVKTGAQVAEGAKVMVIAAVSEKEE